MFSISGVGACKRLHCKGGVSVIPLDLHNYELLPGTLHTHTQTHTHRLFKKQCVAQPHAPFVADTPLPSR